MTRLAYYYQTILLRDMLYKINYVQTTQAPVITKIIVTSSSKECLKDSRFFLNISTALELITNQRAFLLRAKKSNASFKLRKGQVLGAKVTLRQKTLIYNFLDKLFHIILPRLRDYTGLYLNTKNKTLSLNFSWPSMLLFTEISILLDHLKNLSGGNTTIVCSTNDIFTNTLLLSAYGCPIIKKNRIIN